MATLSSAFHLSRLCIFLLVSTLATACGGGSGGAGSSQTAVTTNAESTTATDQTDSPAVPPTTISPPATPTSPTTPFIPAGRAITTIEYHGDSTIWGYRSGSGDRVATPAPAAFAAALPTPERYVVRNRGVSSADACEMLNGGNARYSVSWENYMAASDADIVIINHAINDQWRMNTDRYKSCLNSLASIAKRHGKQVIFETPNPTRDSYPGGLGVYADAMKSVAAAQGAPVIDQYAYLMGRLNGDYRNVTSLIPDGLHPDEATYVMKGRYAAQVFTSLAG